MSYVLAPNQQVEMFPYSIGQLRKDNPQVSFPKNPSDALLATFSMFPVTAVAASYNPETQVATQVGCEYNATASRWETSWTVRDMTAPELTARAAEVKAAAIRSANEVFEQEISAIESAYTPKERETWPQQVAEARAVRRGAGEIAPMIDAILTERPDLTRQQLIDRIEANAAAYSLIVGKALGRMQKKIADLG